MIHLYLICIHGDNFIVYIFRYDYFVICISVLYIQYDYFVVSNFCNIYLIRLHCRMHFCKMYSVWLYYHIHLHNTDFIKCIFINYEDWIELFVATIYFLIPHALSCNRNWYMILLYFRNLHFQWKMTNRQACYSRFTFLYILMRWISSL